jgi:hypothetical protein
MQLGGRDAAMATVYVATAGKRDTYRIGRSTSTLTRRTGSKKNTTLLRQLSLFRWRNGRTVPRRGFTTADTGGRSGGRVSQSVSVALSCGTPRRRAIR